MIIESLDVGFEHFATRARPRTGQGVGSLNQDGKDRIRLLIFVMSSYGVDDLCGLTILAGQVPTDNGM